MVLKQTLLKKINSEKKYMLILKVKKWKSKEVRDLPTVVPGGPHTRE